MEEILIYIVLGVLVAFSSNFLGLGGGVLVGPILANFMLKAAHWSLGVSLASAFLVTLTNTISYHKKGWVPWRLILKVALPAAVMSFLAATSAQALPERWLLLALGSVLLLLGFFLLYQRLLVSSERQQLLYPDWSYPLLGGVSGTLSGLTGVGAGLLFMPFFLTNRLIGAGRAVACSNAAMVFSTGIGSVVYMTHLWKNSGSEGNPFLPVAVITAVSYISSQWIRDVQGALADRVRVGMVMGILFFLGIQTMLRVVAL